MNFLKSLKITGSGEVPQSDKHPWGTDTVIMPIPLDFAQQLRSNNFDNPLAFEYKKFLGYKVFRLIPGFVNNYSANVINDLLEKTINDENTLIFPTPLLYIKMNAWGIKTFKQYRDTLIEYKRKRDVINDSVKLKGLTSQYANSIKIRYSDNFRILKTNPFYWLGTVETKNEMDLLKLIEKQQEKSEDCIFIPLEHEFSYLINGKTYEYLEVDLIKKHYEYLKKIATSSKNVIVVNIAWYTFSSGHGVNMIIDNNLKQIYFSDSNGFNNKCDLGLLHIQLPAKFKKYKKYPVMKTEFCPKGMFQTISNDHFCQTWNLFNMLLITLNRNKLNDINDIDEVFREVIDIVKPICYYEQDMLDNVRLSLIILEFMFYIYIQKRSAINRWLDIPDYDEVYKQKKDELLMSKYAKYIENEMKKPGYNTILDIPNDVHSQITLIAEKESEKEAEEIVKKLKTFLHEVTTIYKYSPNLDSFIDKKITEFTIKKMDSPDTVDRYIRTIYKGK